MSQFQKILALITTFVGTVLLIFQLSQAYMGNRSLITGLLILVSLIAIGVGMWHFAFAKSTIPGMPRYKYHWLAKIALLFIIVLIILVLFYLLTILNATSPVVAQTPQPLTPILLPTPFPRGNLFLNIDFNEKSDGYCNDYDLKILGYESHQYYIKSLSPAGYISHCNSGIWDSIGSLEVEAYPKDDKSVFGYGVLFGWKGNATETTDMCVFGIKRSYKVVNSNDNPEYIPYTQIVVHQRIDGNTIYPNTAQYLDHGIDDNPHIIRMVMLDQNTMLGYLDNVLIISYSFRQCGEGGIGLIAWGTGNTKVYFDNLKLYGLP